MRYFGNAKDRINVDPAIITSPGFKGTGLIDTLNSKNSYVARVSASYDRHVEWMKGTVESHGYRTTSLSTRIQPRDIFAFTPRY